MAQLALITGGSSGMGLEYARQLAAKGYDLLLVSNQEEALQKVAQELSSQYGIKAIGHYQDLACDDAADRLHQWCGEQGLEVEILINNAGMFFFKELLPEDKGKVDAMLHLHILSVTRLCILFGNDMKKREHGHILNMSSMAAKLPAPGITIYAATKAYLRSFGMSLWFEMKPYGVSVTTICPAAIATPLYNLDEKLMNFGVKISVIGTPEALVRKALKAMFRGKPRRSPAFMNVYLPPMLRLLPRNIELKIWNHYR